MKTNRILKTTLTSFLLAFGLISFVGCSSDDETACTASIWYADTDFDGLGDASVSVEACDQPEGYVANSDDTDDTVAFCDVLTWYEDADSDGLGNADVSVEACDQPEGYVANADDDIDVSNASYLVGAEVDGESYFLTTDELLEDNLTIVGNGYEGWAGIATSVDGYLYVVNNTEGLIEKFELTENGPVLDASISSAVLTPGAFFRYIQATDNGDLLLMSNPNRDGDGYTPYAIIDLETFTASSSGFINFPTLVEEDEAGDTETFYNLWANAVVSNGKIYFGSTYGTRNWAEFSDSLVTVVYDYPSLTNGEIITNDVSGGALSGYRTNGGFVTENGDVYQYNITSPLWYEFDAFPDSSSVLVKLTDGAYDESFSIDFDAHFGETVSVWNVWYAGDDIAYANVVKAADVPEWGDLSQNTGNLVEVNLATGVITELNLPDATYVNVYSLNCVEDGNFYIPVNVTGGETSIYEITIGGGANGFTKGATLDGGDVFSSTLLKN